MIVLFCCEYIVKFEFVLYYEKDVVIISLIFFQQV